MKIYFAVFLVNLLSYTGFSQALRSEIGIDGLTCSSCSYSAEQALRQLESVQNVVMDLNTAVATVTFKSNSESNFNELAQKIRDAGYSVRFVRATFLFDKAPVESQSTYGFGNLELHFIKSPQLILTGEQTVTLAGKRFQSKREYKRWRSIIEEDKELYSKDKNVYFVYL